MCSSTMDLNCLEGISAIIKGYTLLFLFLFRRFRRFYALWLNVMNKKNELAGRLFWRPIQKALKCFFIPRSLVWRSWIKFNNRQLETNIFLAKSYLSDQNMVKWLCCKPLVTRHNPNRQLQCAGQRFGIFCKPVLVKSSTRLLCGCIYLLHLRQARPDMFMPLAMSHWRENSTITLYEFFFIDGRGLAFTSVLPW